jgi:NAD(P)-dependent dehydrogenase (short-subunit alcohol dehydrogenase family)
VTGGARGLGLAIAESLAAAGANVCLLDILPTGSEQAAAIAKRFSVDTSYSTVDVTDQTSIERAFDAVEREIGTADILVNSAGITSGMAGLDVSPREWDRVFAVNVTGTMTTSQVFARRFLASKRDADNRSASIVNLSSMSAFTVNVPQTQSAYNASKAAVSALTRSLAIEWLPHGIRVNAIAPGYFASDMTREFADANPDMASEWISKIPAGRMGEPHELGPLVCYLASDAAAYVIGQSFVIDGGYTLI